MKRNRISVMIIVLVMILVASMTALSCSKCNSDDIDGEVKIVFDGYLSTNNVSVRVNEKYALNVLNVNITEWSSSNESVVTVSDQGVVTGKAEGIAFIYAVSEEGQTYCCIVSVVVPNTNVDRIELSESEYYMGVGDVYGINATVIYEMEDLGEVVIWNVSNNEICSLETEGNKAYITANGIGETFVVASLGGKVAQCKLIIREKRTNESDFTEIPSEMATAQMTKNYYELGRINNSATQEGTKTTIYGTAFYEKKSLKYSIEAFATLSDGKKEINWTAENYYAYGFYLQTIQVYDGDAGMQGSDRIYYAYNGTDENGKYGIQLENVPKGYFAIYSFIEYLSGGTLVREISSDKVMLGEYNPDFISSSSDLEAFVINRSWHGTIEGKICVAGVFAGAEAIVVEGGEAFSRIKPKYEINAPIMKVYNGSSSVYPSVMVKAKTIMTKKMLQENLGDGISVLRFKVCYRTDSDKKYTGYLGTTNLSVLDNTFPKTVTDVRYDDPDKNKLPTYYGAVSGYEGLYEEYIARASITREIVSDTWYTVEYNVKDLIEDYDIFFADKAEYPFFAFSMNDKEAVDTGRDGRVLISDFEFVTIAYNDIFSEQDMYSFVLSSNGLEGEGNWKYLTPTPSSSRVCNTVEAENAQDIIDFEDAKGVTKNVKYKFKYTYISFEQIGLPETERYKWEEDYAKKQKEQGRYLLMAFENNKISKTLLEELLTLGYENFGFSFVVDDNGRANTLKVKTIDFDYLKENSDKTLMSNDRYGLQVNDDAFKVINVSSSEARNWYTVSYKIQDLLDFYDQIFGCPKLLLAQAWTDYTEGDTKQDQYPYYYISKVGFRKVSIDDTATHPDIFD